MIRAILFDFDGTILDTEWPDLESWRQEYRHHGVELDESDWLSALGSAWVDPYVRLERLTGGPVNRGQVQRRRRKLYADLIALEPLRPGVEEWLRDAQAAVSAASAWTGC